MIAGSRDSVRNAILASGLKEQVLCKASRTRFRNRLLRS